jgi:hypothetical protein
MEMLYCRTTTQPRSLRLTDHMDGDVVLQEDAPVDWHVNPLTRCTVHVKLHASVYYHGTESFVPPRDVRIVGGEKP